MSETGRWLEQQGLGEFAELFDRERIELELLPELSDPDLKELGLPLGSRRRLLKAIREQLPACGGVRDLDGPSLYRARHAPEPERRQLSVMFCDLVGSTLLSERMDPEEYREVLLAYQDIASEAISRYGGFIARFLGDGILVYFGFPRAHEDDAERAIRAGLGVVRSMGELSQRFAGVAGTRFAVRVGIATGPVVVGDIIGAGASQASTALGRTPNVAARLQALAAPNGVVISSVTHDLVGRLFDYEDLGLRRLKGVSEPVRVWSVREEGEHDSRFEARARELTPLVGRDREMERLHDLWREARSGSGQVALISGEAGIGKSRLTRALSDVAQREPSTLLRYQCSPYHANSALFPVIRQLEHALPLRRNSTVEERLDAVEALVARTADGVQSAAPLMAALLAIPGEARYGPLQLAPQQLKDRTLGALREQVWGLAEAAPVLLVVEDAHWIDATTSELVRMLVSDVAARRVLVLVTYRPAFACPWVGEPRVSLLPLGRLPSTTCASMIQSITKGKPLPDVVTERIIDKTDGIPLFVEELTKTVLTSGSLQEDSDRYTVADVLPSLAIPDTLRDSLMARLDRLGSVKEIAQLGAVIGREFSHELVHALSSRPAAELDQALEELVRSGLVYRVGDAFQRSYTFKHALIQDTAYASLLKSRRRRLHAQIAAALEERIVNHQVGQPEIAAHHSSQAGMTYRAVEYWHRAGALAGARSANVEAYSHYCAALEAAETLAPSPTRDRQKLDLLVESITPAMALKGFAAPEVEAIYIRALALCERLGEYTPKIFPVLYGRWLARLTNGQLEEAGQLADAFLALAEGQESRLQIALGRRCVATVAYLRGGLSVARRTFREVLDEMGESDSDALGYAYGQDSLVGLLSHYALVLVLSGDLDQGRRRSEAALERARKLGHPQTLAWAHVLAGTLRSVLRDGPALHACAEVVARTVDEHPMALLAVGARTLAGCAALLNGDYDRAVSVLEEAIAAREALNSRWLLPGCLCDLGRAYLGAGAPDRGLEAVDKGFAEIARGSTSWCKSELHRIRGHLLLARGAESAVVESCYREALTVARAQGARLFELRAAVATARFDRARKGARMARSLLEPVCLSFTEGLDVPEVLEANALLDELREEDSLEPPAGSERQRSPAA